MCVDGSMVCAHACFYLCARVRACMCACVCVRECVRECVYYLGPTREVVLIERVQLERHHHDAHLPGACARERACVHECVHAWTGT